MMADAFLINTLLPAVLFGIISIGILCYACLLLPIALTEASEIVHTTRSSHRSSVSNRRSKSHSPRRCQMIV